MRKEFLVALAEKVADDSAIHDARIIGQRFLANKAVAEATAAAKAMGLVMTRAEVIRGLAKFMPEIAIVLGEEH
jgi:hypothetical protein